MELDADIREYYGRGKEAARLRQGVGRLEFWRTQDILPRCSVFPAICSPSRSRPCHDAEVAYDEGLATRVRKLVGGETGITEQKMFGGVAMLLNGNMAVGVRGRGLLVRTDPDEQDRLLAEPGAHIFDMSGRPMQGWLVVDAEGLAKEKDLRRWVKRGVAFAKGLPPK